MRANPNITAERLHAIEHSKRLDRPVIVRYGYWVRDAARSKFGTTLFAVVAIAFGGDLFAGAIVTETIFTLDGMGFYFINALQASDPYPIMAWLMIAATMVIVFNLVADILYGVLDPRIRYD